MRRNNSSIKQALDIKIPGERGRVRLKKAWIDSINIDRKTWKMPATAENRLEWRFKINNAMQTCNPHRGGKAR